MQNTPETTKISIQIERGNIKMLFHHFVLNPLFSGVIGFSFLFTFLILTKIFTTIFYPTYILNVTTNDIFISLLGFLGAFLIKLLLILRKVRLGHK